MIERHANLMGKLTTIALATDGSSWSDGAIKEAIFFSHNCGAKLVVINIIAVDSEPESGVASHSSYSVQHNEAIKFIEIKKQATENGIPCEIVIEKSYQPDKSIVEIADKYQAYLIINGSPWRYRLTEVKTDRRKSNIKSYRTSISPSTCCSQGVHHQYGENFVSNRWTLVWPSGTGISTQLEFS
jgi:nucleotide-binding universal stress UspA family protein